MHIVFLTLKELAEAAGFTPAESGLFFDELCNDPHSLLQPYVMMPAGFAMAVTRGALASQYYFNQGDVRIRKDAVDEYIEARTRVIAAKPAEDAKGYPVDFVGRADLKAFQTGEHIAAWLADGGVILSDDVDADIHKHLMEIIESESPE